MDAFFVQKILKIDPFGVSGLDQCLAGEQCLGLTIIAAGTSMPELATSVAASIKGERDMAVGNVVGSCTFNVLGCLGVSALASGAAGLLAWLY